MGTQKPSGGGGKAGEVRAGGGFWELNLRDNLSKSLDKIQAKIKAFGSMLSSAGGGLMKGGAALGAGPLALLFGGGSRLAETAQLARQFRIPIEMMGKFQYAAERAGVSVEEVMEDTKGRFRDLLGKAPLVDPRQAESALKIQNDFKDSIRALQDALTPLLQVLAPIVSQVARFVQQNAGAVKVIAAVSAGLFGLGLAFKLTGVSVVGLAGLVPAAFGAMLSPIGLVAVAAAGLTAAFVTQTETGQKMFADLKAGFNEFLGTATEAWGGIVAAVGKGDLAAALEVGLAAVSLEWVKAVAWWTDVWNKFNKHVIDRWRDTTSSLGVGLAVIGEKLGVVPEGTTGALIMDWRGENAARGRERDADLARAQAAVAAAQNRFRGAVAVANAPGGPNNPTEEQKRFAEHGMRNVVKAFDEVKGNFSTASAMQQFGYGSSVKEETEINRAIRENTKQTAEAVLKLVMALNLR